MRYRFNNTYLDSVDLDVPGVWFDWRKLFCVYLDFRSGFSFRELDKVSACNIWHNGLCGRKSKRCINIAGLSEWICHSLRFTPHEKSFFIEELRSQGLLSSDVCVSSSRKELDFFSELGSFFDSLGISVDMVRQHWIGDYRVDCLLDGHLVVEFDENKHLSYDSSRELVRERYILDNGYSLVRVDDKMLTGESIGLIYKKYLEWKQKF